MVKILFFIPQLVGGGAERVTVNIIKMLDKNFFDIHLVVTTTKFSVYENLPEDITLHDLKILKTSASIFALRKLIKRLDPDMLFSSLLRGHIAISIALMGSRKRPFLIFRSPNSPKLLIKYKQISRIENFFLEYAYKTADVILAQTPEMKDEIIQYHKVKVDKVKVLINPIDSSLINEKIKHIENPFNPNNINVVASGRIVYQKGFDILIQSFKYVVDQNPLYKLYIIGGGAAEEVKALKKLVDTFGLFEHVFFLGFQDNPYKYYYFSDLYVLSSRWEGLPNTVLENLYLQKPIVSTRCIPYMETLISERKNGLLVNVEDVDALAEAVLNYKSITCEFIETVSIEKRVNDFFKVIKEESYYEY